VAVPTHLTESRQSAAKQLEEREARGWRDLANAIDMTELGDLLDLFRRATMGCICAKEKINIDGSTYTVREQIAEG
jgi:hypothetical protein